ncbi:MAG: transglycosylase SLT domain-containing protein [bacterium]|nr:transglycosylase SLT domain-containing protein [bacterium]
MKRSIGILAAAVIFWLFPADSPGTHADGPSPSRGKITPSTSAEDPVLLLRGALARAREMARAGKPLEAIDFLDKFLVSRIAKGDLDIFPVVLNLKGLILLQAKQPGKAMEVFRLVLTQRPEDEFARKMLTRLKGERKPKAKPEQPEKPPAPNVAAAPPGRSGPFRNQRDWIPISEDHPRVKAALAFFTRQKRGRGILQRWINRSEPFIPIVGYIFRRTGIPAELSLMMLVESGGNPKAVSHAGAVGSFQFMQRTAKEYKLHVRTGEVDERKSTEKAALAAALYLRKMTEIHGFDWASSLAAYNCGPGCVQRAMRNSRARDYFALHTLPRETQDYVPRIYAVILIFRDLDRYGFRYDPQVARYEVREMEGPIPLDEIARREGTTVSDLKRLNPELLGDSIPPGTYLLKVPPRRQPGPG